MTQDQQTMNEFVLRLNQMRTLANRLVKNMNASEQRAWKRMFQSHLDEMSASIKRLDKKAKERSPTLTEMLSY